MILLTQYRSAATTADGVAPIDGRREVEETIKCAENSCPVRFSVPKRVAGYNTRVVINIDGWEEEERKN